MLVSIALCTYNGEKYIKEQLISIIKQTILPDEIIISDDNSTDQTLEIVQKVLSETSIPYQIIKNTPAKGVVNNFMDAIAACQHDIIITCDQDDVWMNNKIEKIKDVFLSNSSIKLVFSNALVVDKNLQPFPYSLFDSVNFVPNKTIYEKMELLPTLFSHCVVTGATMAFHTSIRYQQGSIETSGWLHDGWLAIIANTEHSVCVINEPLIKYRQHGNNEVGTTNQKSLQSAIVEHLKQFSKFRNSIQNRFCIYLKEASSNYNKYFFYKQYLEQNTIYLPNTLFDCLNACIAFWEVKANVKSGKLITIFRLFKYLIVGNYRTFDKGFKGYLYDVIVILFGKQK